MRINLTISLSKAQGWPENNFLAKFARLSRERRKERRGSSSFVGDEARAPRWSAESATGTALIYFVTTGVVYTLGFYRIGQAPAMNGERRLSNYPRLRQEEFVREIRRNENETNLFRRDTR